MTRRTALGRGMTVVAGAGILAVTASTTACGDRSERDADRRIADQLEPLATAARADAAAATALIASNADSSKALRVVADERNAHAKALTDEVGRLRRESPKSPSASTSERPASLQALRDQLIRSRTAVGNLALNESGYQAGLLGSISAAIAAEIEVQLA